MTNVATIQERQSSTSASNTSLALAFSSSITLNSSLHNAVVAPSGTTLSCADNQNGSHGTALDSISPGAAAFAHFRKDAAAAGATTVTASYSPGTTFVGIWIKEIGPTSGYDSPNGHAAQVQTTGTTRSSGNATPSTQPGLVSSFGYNDSDDNAMSPDTGSGFVAGAASPGWDFGFTGFSGSGSESLRYTSTAPIASTYTGAITTDATGVVQALFIEAAAPPTIVEQPGSLHIKSGDTAALQVVATSIPGSPTYQWQDNRTGTFANVTDGTGGTAAAYLTAALTTGATGRQYQVLVTDANGTTTSSAATITVDVVTTGSLADWDSDLRLLAWF